LTSSSSRFWTIIKILDWTESYFKDISLGLSKADSSKKTSVNHNQKPKLQIDSPRLTAEILLAHTLKLERLDLYLQHDRPLEKEELAVYKSCIKRRAAGEPVAYITGVKGFYESDFKVANGVLIPRPDTETLVENALNLMKSDFLDEPGKKILELGVGSGAIIVSLAKAAPDHFYFANDVSLSALGIAHENSQQIVGDQIRFFAGTWFTSMRPMPFFDLIVSNPPYIPTQDIQNLQLEIKSFEPLLALDGGTDGLDCYKIILEQAHEYLLPGGSLMLEIGFDQQDGIRAIFQNYPQYETIEFIRDLAGHDRVVKIKKMID